MSGPSERETCQHCHGLGEVGIANELDRWAREHAAEICPECGNPRAHQWHRIGKFDSRKCTGMAYYR